MSAVIKPSRRFWIVQMCSVALVTLFVTLGMWQLERGNVKSEIEGLQAENLLSFENIVLPLEGLEGQRYKRIKLHGRYNAEKQFILDNQVRDGIAGYNVITPFYAIHFNEWLLVDRGWIPQGQSREIYPDIDFILEEMEVRGSVYVPYDSAYSLGGIADGEDSGWPRRIQFVDYQMLGERLGVGVSLQLFTLRLDSNEPMGYRRDWADTNMAANKHYGYAFQWFAMAIAMIVLWWVYSITTNIEREMKNNDSKLSGYLLIAIFVVPLLVAIAMYSLRDNLPMVKAASHGRINSSCAAH